MRDFAVILAAAGAGRRFGARKQLLELLGRPMIHHSLDVFASVYDVLQIVLVMAPEDLEGGARIVASWRASSGQHSSRDDLIMTLVAGGARRQDSVRRGLDRISSSAKYVLVHDAARPLLTREEVGRMVEATRREGASVLGTPALDSVKRVVDGEIVEELARDQVWLVQTPQSAVVETLRRAYDAAGDTEMTDEASALRRIGVRVALVEGSRENLKITKRGDEALAEAILRARRESGPATCSIQSGPMYRTGLGYDNHRLVTGRSFWLGGVQIPAPVGEDAHSDGDVLIHALCDALYGAAGRGDIGEHFADTDERWKDRPSAHFLEHAACTARNAGYRLLNIDATVLLEKIKLSPHKRQVSEHLRGLLKPFWDLPEDAVSIKAKTKERCDSVGRGEAVEAFVTVLLERLDVPVEKVK